MEGDIGTCDGVVTAVDGSTGIGIVVDDGHDCKRGTGDDDDGGDDKDWITETGSADPDVHGADDGTAISGVALTQSIFTVAVRPHEYHGPTC